MDEVVYRFAQFDRRKVLEQVGQERALAAYRQMLLIRQFEQRGEAAYQQGLVGGFYHSAIGQEAIQTACVAAVGQQHWYTTSYRCHALALLLGVSADEAMAELYGRETGNAKGRGGSMHLFANNLLGGHGIVGGQLPVAAGAALSSRLLQQNKLSIVFCGDGAVAQGAFHESLNLVSLWSLPLLTVIENNRWGMGTDARKAISVAPIAQIKAPGYGMLGYSVDGSDFLACFELFDRVGRQMMQDQRPVLLEALTQRFRGHSISDPGLYRSKDELAACIASSDPIKKLEADLVQAGWLDEGQDQAYQDEARGIVLQAMDFALKSPWPTPAELEAGVLAPPEGAS
jgi:pyruvate dehydrogenase E1 component alpha subunit